MTAQLAKNCSIFVDGYDLSCAFRELGILKNSGELETTALCTTGDRTFIAGLKDGTLSLTGFYDFDDTDLDALGNILDSAFSNQDELIVSASLGLLAVGDPAFMCQGGQTKYDIESVLNQLVMTQSGIRANGNIFRGAWAFNQAVNAATVVGGVVDNGAASADGGILHFHAHTPDGTITDSSVLIEHSIDGLTWTTLIADTAIGAANGAIVVSVAAGTTVKRYSRASVTTTGGQATAVAAFYRR